MVIIPKVPPSDKYIRSKNHPDEHEQDYYYTIAIIGDFILEIKLCSGQLGQHEVSTNFEYNYEELMELLLRKDNYEYFYSIDKIDPLKLICKNIRNSILIPDNCIDIISSFTYKKIPLFVLNDVINYWIEEFQEKVSETIKNLEFKRELCEIDSSEERWLYQTICNWESVLEGLEERFRN